MDTDHSNLFIEQCYWKSSSIHIIDWGAASRARWTGLLEGCHLNQNWATPG